MRRTCNQYCCQLFLLIVGTIGATGYPVALSSPPSHDPRLQTRVTSHYLAWNGRALAVMNAGITARPTPHLSIGGAYRYSHGRGHSTASRYGSTGWGGRADWRMLTRQAGRSSLSLAAEHATDQVHLHSIDINTSLQADPSFAATGVRVVMEAPYHALTSMGWAGMYTARVNAQHVANVHLLGAGLARPLGRRTRVYLAVTGYRDDYQGQHFSQEVQLGLTAHVGPKGEITLSGSVFPHGIPIAGTPLSAAAAVGTIYGGSAVAQLRTQPAGYLSLSAQCRW